MIERRADHILVNAVCPGFIGSPLGDSLADAVIGLLGLADRATFQQFLYQYNLLKRVGQPEEVATMVRALASARASSLPGCIFDVDGGFSKPVI